MTKQEEIREELVSRIYRMNKDDIPLGETVDGILVYLNDNGVVLRVDRGLPTNKMACNMRIIGEPIITRQVQEDIRREIDIWADAQRDMVEAGYVAVEPLIEVCEHDWVKLRNEVVTSGEMCSKCKAIRAEQ